MYSVELWQYSQGGSQYLAYEQTFDDVQHFHGDTWLATRDNRKFYIRPSHEQLLVIEQLPKSS